MSKIVLEPVPKLSDDVLATHVIIQRIRWEIARAMFIPPAKPEKKP